MGFSISASGSFDKTEAFLNKLLHGDIYAQLGIYAQQGVDALRSATPKETGETADSWTYEILKDSTSYSIIWGNTHVVDGRPVAIMLQYGHGTGTGGYVEGRDFINPALKPIFDRIANDVWKAVTSS